jgi:predicted DNA-binding antitoxin AbrB/MazE fold protein
LLMRHGCLCGREAGDNRGESSDESLGRHGEHAAPRVLRSARMVHVKARYESGMLRPLQGLDLPEGATVEITIVSDDWKQRLEALLKRIRAKAGLVAPDEVEADISSAADEVRAKRLSRKSSAPSWTPTSGCPRS